MAEAHRLLGRVFLVSGEYDRAEVELKTGINVLRDHPTPLVAWKLWGTLAEVLRRVGDDEGVRNAVDESAAIVRSIARSVVDPVLHDTFLNAPAVRAVVACQSET
jgi:hypothetical protein